MTLTDNTVVFLKQADKLLKDRDSFDVDVNDALMALYETLGPDLPPRVYDTMQDLEQLAMGEHGVEELSRRIATMLRAFIALAEEQAP